MENKYDRLLKNCQSDLAEECAAVAKAEGACSLETLARIKASIQAVETARLCHQVWEDTIKDKKR